LNISVEHDPVSGSRFNRILQFRTRSRSDWISKYTQPEQIWIMDIQTALITAIKCLIRVFFGYQPDWIKYLDRSTGLLNENFGLE